MVAKDPVTRLGKALPVILSKLTPLTRAIVVLALGNLGLACYVLRQQGISESGRIYVICLCLIIVLVSIGLCYRLESDRKALMEARETLRKELELYRQLHDQHANALNSIANALLMEDMTPVGRLTVLQNTLWKLKFAMPARNVGGMTRVMPAAFSGSSRAYIAAPAPPEGRQ
jgi:hypothetical protein